MVFEYDIHQHMHRFASWAACRASSVPGQRFSVQDGTQWILQAGLDRIVYPDDLPKARNLDKSHREWRRAIIGASGMSGMRDGQAAKLINIYLKSRLMNPEWAAHPRIAALHPPIDGILLTKLDKARRSADGMIWIRAKRDGWSRLSSRRYEELIDTIRNILEGAPLWMVEKYWPGFRS